MKYFVLAFFALILSQGIPGLGCDDCGEVEVSFYGNFCAKGNYTITLHDGTANGNGRGCGTYTESSKGVVHLKPNTQYTLTATASEASSVHVSLSMTKPCYQLLVDGEESTTADGNQAECHAFTKSWTVVVQFPSGSGPGTFGNGGGGLGSVKWDFSLGGTMNGSTAGSISIRETSLTAASYTPACLNYVPPSPEVTVIRDGQNALRQVKAPDGLADIVTIDPEKFEIRFYSAADAGAFSGGLYHPTGSPLSVWTIGKPIGAAIGEKLAISKLLGGVTTTREFANSVTTGAWSYVEAGREELHSIAILPNGDEETTTIVRDPVTQQIASKKKDIQHHFAWGKKTIQTVEDPDGAALTTTYAYYENEEDGFGHYGRLKWTIHPNGAWEKYQYNDAYGAAGLISHVFRPWKDAPATPAEAGFDNCRVTEYYYSSLTSGIFQSELSRERESILGLETSNKEYQSYFSTLNGEPAKVRITTNRGLRYEIATYKTTASPLVRGQTAYVQYSDSRRETYSYETGDYDPSSGIFVAGPGPFVRQLITQGTADEPNGSAYKTKRKATVRDSGGKIVCEEEQVFDGDVYEPVTRTQISYNSDGNAIQVKRNGRIISETTWANGRKSSETDQVGQTVSYTYDALDRVENETSAGVTLEYTYDLIGRVLSKTRHAGGINLTSSTVYDNAGRIISETAEDGLTTTTTYDGNGRGETRTFPNGATTTTERFLDGRTKSVTGTAEVVRYFDYGVETGNDGDILTWELERIGGGISPRWNKTWRNGAGQTLKTERPGFEGAATTVFSYNSKGQVVGQMTTGEGTRLLEYDSATGNVVRTGQDADGNDIIELGGKDRVTEQAVSYQEIGGQWYQVTVMRQYETVGNSTPVITLTTQEQLTGLTTSEISKTIVTDRLGRTTTRTKSVNRATQTMTETVSTSTSNLSEVQTSVNGLLVSSTSTTVAQPTIFQYDAVGREIKITDPRGIETVTAYEPGTGRVQSVSVAGKTTTYEYYGAPQIGAGRIKSLLRPDGSRLRFDYSLRGELTRTWGGGTHPVEAVYDHYGQRVELRTFRGGAGWDAATWPSSPGTADATTWTYQESTGLLVAKTNADGRSVQYTYTPSGQLYERLWSRGVRVTHYYNLLGDEYFADYSDGTPDVTFTYDRVGQITTLDDAAGTHTFSNTNSQTTEVVAGGILNGVEFAAARDGQGRRSGFTASLGGWTETTGYSYDAAGRLETVASGSTTAAYTYLPNSDRVQTTTLKNSGTTQLTITRTWDNSDRLSGLTNVWPSGTRSYAVTQFDASDRRQQITWGDGSRWDYIYNPKGEVLSASRKWIDGSDVQGQQLHYGFDEIGNRISTSVNGRSAAYTANKLNQIVERTIPGAIDVSGTASAAATVLVNGVAAQRQGQYFYQELNVSNAAAVGEAAVTVAATDGSGTTTRNLQRLVPRTPETFTYDVDGNLLGDGYWTYQWDAENRLVALESNSAVPDASKRKIVYTYDGIGRRIQIRVWHRVGNEWVIHHILRCLYDGWNLIAEIGDTGRRVRSYTWGLDLSGNVLGAGGVGGLLFERQFFAGPSAEGQTLAAGFDLNGNITGLVDTSSGELAAAYEYGAFGEDLRSSGPLATANPFRWGTKYLDSETGFAYFGFRYYHSQTGCWLSSDPIEDNGGVNTYGFVLNNPVNNLELLGLAPICVSKNEEKSLERPYSIIAVNEEKPAPPTVTSTGIVVAGKRAQAGKVYDKPLWMVVATAARRGWDRRGILSAEPKNQAVEAEKKVILYEIFEVKTDDTTGKVTYQSHGTGAHGNEIFSQWRPTSYPGNLNGFGMGNVFGLFADPTNNSGKQPEMLFTFWAAYGFDDDWQVKWAGDKLGTIEAPFKAPKNTWKEIAGRYAGPQRNNKKDPPPMRENGDDSNLVSLPGIKFSCGILKEAAK